MSIPPEMLSSLPGPPTGTLSSFPTELPQHSFLHPPSPSKAAASFFISSQLLHLVEPSRFCERVCSPYDETRRCVLPGQARSQSLKHPSAFCLAPSGSWEVRAAPGRTGSVTELLALRRMHFAFLFSLALLCEDLACHMQPCASFYLYSKG